jgi:Flp pilus assembly protein TadG
MKTLSNIFMVMLAIGLIIVAWSHFTKIKNDAAQAVAAEQTLEQSTQAQAATAPEWTACETDDQCIAIGTECCQANYSQAVNVNFADMWRVANPKQDCAPDVMCIMMVKTARCEKGQCTVAPTNAVTE